MARGADMPVKGAKGHKRLRTTALGPILSHFWKRRFKLREVNALYAQWAGVALPGRLYTYWDEVASEDLKD